MNDHELTLLAAKAAGYEVRAMSYESPELLCIRLDPNYSWMPLSEWCPLDNDGDALRLAMKLRIQVRYEHTCSNSDATMTVFAAPSPVSPHRDANGASVDFLPGNVPSRIRDIEKVHIAYMLRTGKWIDGEGAATRRAIVRAAAEIGRAMP